MSASATIAAPAISTEHLTRRFGDLVAVQDVNLRVAPGQFFGFLGPNGAGKSTTIKMLTGLLAPSSGRMQILGVDLTQDSIEVKRQIGVVPEGMALFGRLSGSEYLNFVGRMYGLDRSTAAKRSAELLDFMQLVDQPKALVTDYSHGMQKKLALAAAVIHGPKILFLDEPFEGVDAIASNTLKSMLQNMIARGATIFLTSHVLEIVERLCSHVAIIHRGQLVAQGSLEQLRAGVEARGAGALRAAPIRNARGWDELHSRNPRPVFRHRSRALAAFRQLPAHHSGPHGSCGARIRFLRVWHGRTHWFHRARLQRVVFRFQRQSGLAPSAALACIPVLAAFSGDGQRFH